MEVRQRSCGGGSDQFAESGGALIVRSELLLARSFVGAFFLDSNPRSTID